MASTFKPSFLTLLFFFLPLFFKLINCLHNHDQAPPLPKDEDDYLNESRCSVIIFLVTCFSGFLPYVFKYYLVLGSQFSGGVFLAHSMHLLSDSGGWLSPHFPLSLMLIGYFVTAFGDIMLVRIIKKKLKKKNAERSAEVGHIRRDVTVAEEELAAVEKAGAVGTCVILLLVLFVDSLCEGMKLFHLRRHKKDEWISTLWICIRHILLDIAMSFAVLRTEPTYEFLPLLACSFTFGVSSLIGIAIGVERDLAYWILDYVFGIASGIYLYISINHLIAKVINSDSDYWESDGGSSPLHNFFAVLLGVLLAGW